MRDDYKINGATSKIELELEKDVIEKLKAMSQHTQLSPAEITNTALKRFIATHKDFFSKDYLAQKKKAG